MQIIAVVVGLLASVAAASPIEVRADATTSAAETTVATDVPAATQSVYDWQADYQPQFPIHQSCNASQTRQLQRGLSELVELAQHAKDHLMAFGQASPLVQKYFGNGSTAYPAGWYDRVVSANKGAMLFRCDDPDKNCATQDQWAGHWRGSNATEETVICDLSFVKRRYLDSFCSQGYTVSGSATNTFWASDLLHRVYHVPTISEKFVEHYSEGDDEYTSALALAKADSSLAAVNSDTLQFFALEAYAYDIVVPGVGCL